MTRIFNTCEALTKNNTWKPGLEPRASGNQGNQSPIYHYAICVCARFSGFQIYINFDFSTKTDKVMAEHNKVVWGVVPDLGPYLESC